MDLREYEYDMERRHPWEEVRFRFFVRQLARAGAIAPGATILDVGAGDAWFSCRLARGAPSLRVTCWDAAYPVHPPASAGKLPPNVRLHLSAEKPVERVSTVLLLDVLEHVEDDALFLRELVRESLEPGGRVLVSVPAWPALFGSHDVRLQHHRRYTARSARNCLKSAGLEVRKAGGLFHLLLLPRALQVLRERLSRRPHPPRDLGHWKAPALVSALVETALLCDAALGSVASYLRCDLPGLSWWALCQKPSR